MSSNADVEETCKFETVLLPCTGAVKWDKLAIHLDESLKIFNHKLATEEARHFQKQRAQLMQMLSAPHEDTQDEGHANRGQLANLMEELLLESHFVPATPRPSAVRVTPHVEDAEAQASEIKTVLQKMEVLREDQKIGTNVRFCKNGNHADSAANFCSKATKLTKEKLRKAIEVIEATQRMQLPQ